MPEWVLVIWLQATYSRDMKIMETFKYEQSCKDFKTELEKNMPVTWIHRQTEEGLVYNFGITKLQCMRKYE